MNPSIKHLKAFMALVREQNFTRAAETCHLSQPAFSTLMRNLEDHAGVRLFDRSARVVTLTPEGQVFALTAERVLQDFEGAFTELREHVSRRKGRVTIAALPSIAGGALPAVISRFVTDYPGIDILLKDITADLCVKAVRERQADFALTASIEPGVDLASEPVLTDSFHLVCREDHPLARRRRLTLRDIVALPQIRFDRASSIRQHIDAAFYPAQPVTAMEVIHPVTAAGLIASGIGVTLAPTLALFQFQLPGLVAVPVQLPIKDRELCLVRRRDGADSVAATAFIETLVSVWKVKTPPSRR
ncbi:LysR family transcriptional regulator [Pigmentiphaga litoralis]|uniref:LysR family transcriptional regulator n=1 Tax=Pigmentiphaga litoralis TaxID=516702 RepID=UPI003B42FF73